MITSDDLCHYSYSYSYHYQVINVFQETAVKESTSTFNLTIAAQVIN